MANLKQREALEVEWLTEKIQQQIWKGGKFLNNTNEKSTASFKILDLKIKFIGGDEAFMLTTCYRANVTYEHDGAKASQPLLVKRTPNLPRELFESIQFEALFGNEINAYEHIMPAFTELTGQDFNLVKFYSGEVGADNANIILEDFSPRNWRVCKEMVNLSLEHILLGTSYLAKFHAAGFAMRHTRRERFDTLVDLLKESRYANSSVHPDYSLFSQTSGNRLLHVVQQHQPSVPLELLQRLERMQQNFMGNNKKRVAPVEPWITLCHGDYLRNNIAFKYEDTEGKQPLDVLMFDLQTLRLGSPMIDLGIFLGLSAFAEVRHKYFEKIMTTYGDQLIASYRAFAPDHTLPNYFNQAALRTEYVRLLPYSISIASAFLPVLVVPEKELTSEEFLNRERTPAEIIEDAMTRGGRVVDEELAHQVKELHNLMEEQNIDVFDGCDF